MPSAIAVIVETDPDVVLLDLALTQLDLASSSRGLVRHYRVGTASRGFEDSNVTHRTEAFDGIGLRPYPIAHFRASDLGGDFQLTWKRRTRIDGDTWQSPEVPLGEDSEAYQVRVILNSAIVAEYTVTQPQFTYTSAMRTANAVSGAFDIAVAQLSTSFGPGPFRKLTLAA